MGCPFSNNRSDQPPIGNYSAAFNSLENRMRSHSTNYEEPYHEAESPGSWVRAREDEKTVKLLEKIWGTKRDGVETAVNLSHFSLFVVPEIIKSAHLMSPVHYSEFGIGLDLDDITDTLCGALLQKIPQKSHGVRQVPSHGVRQVPIVIYGQHLPLKDQARQGDLEPYLWSPPGVPHLPMGHSFYEILRASELLAENRGVTLTETELARHYEYFKKMVQSTGYSFPETRQEMEAIAAEIDSQLVAYSRKVATHVDRLYRLSMDTDSRLKIYNRSPVTKLLTLKLRSNHGSTLETVEKFLAPKSLEVFSQVAEEYNFKRYENGVK